MHSPHPYLQPSLLLAWSSSAYKGADETTVQLREVLHKHSTLPHVSGTGSIWCLCWKYYQNRMCLLVGLKLSLLFTAIKNVSLWVICLFVKLINEGLKERLESQSRIKGLSQEPAVTTPPLSPFFLVQIQRKQGHDAATLCAPVRLPEFSFWALQLPSSMVKLAW